MGLKMCQDYSDKLDLLAEWWDLGPPIPVCKSQHCGVAGMASAPSSKPELHTL